MACKDGKHNCCKTCWFYRCKKNGMGTLWYCGLDQAVLGGYDPACSEPGDECRGHLEKELTQKLEAEYEAR